MAQNYVGILPLSWSKGKAYAFDREQVHRSFASLRMTRGYYNAPEYLQQRHGFPADLLKNIAGIAALIQKAVE